jgi:hypothetical protein
MKLDILTKHQRPMGIVNLLPWCCNRCMNTPNVDFPSYRHDRFPATVISHCVWLYFRFALTYYRLIRFSHRFRRDRGGAERVNDFETPRGIYLVSKDRWCWRRSPVWVG